MHHIISPNQLPIVERSDDEQQITACITGDTELTFASDKVVSLSPLLTDAFNALLSSRDQALPIEQIHEKVSGDTSLQKLQKNIGMLAAELFAVTETGIIQVEGHDPGPLTYQITPQLTIVDQRQTIAERQTEHPITRLRRSIASQEAYAPRTRKAIVSYLLKEYTDHPDIRPRLTMLYEQNVIATEEGRLPENGTPTAQDCDGYFAKIEEGIVAISEGVDADEAKVAALGLVEAYHTIYYRHIFLVASIAKLYSRRNTSYSELFQEGNLALLDILTHHLSYGKALYEPEGSTFSEDAHHAIHMRLKNVDGYGGVRGVLTPTIMRRRAAIETARCQYAESHDRQPTLKELSAIVNLTTQEIMEAISDPRRPRQPTEAKPEKNEEEWQITQAMDSAMSQEEMLELLREGTLTDREQIIISLYFGIFANHLRGASFIHTSPFLYPHTEERMPGRPLSVDQIGQLLEVRPKMVHALLHLGLKNARAHLEAQGIEAHDVI